MRSAIICTALLSAIALSSGAVAATAENGMKTGEFVTTSDGKRIGRIYDFDKAKDGSFAGIALIRDNKIIHIPASTLTNADKGVTTSMTYADIKKLK
jgi:hypothetical protein